MTTENNHMTREQQYIYDNALVPGIFKTDRMATELTFQYYKWSEDGVLKYHFYNLERVVIPRMVAEELYKKRMFSYHHE